ncbi:MAG: endonuclease/exonuclease/phosphatase family protein [Pirellulaceae bacterium]|nr:endonuclease/exonuclease/phosphatase family protein [Pirellulaceae bacterium]
MRNKLLLGIPISVFAALLLGFCGFSYIVRPNALAAFTFIPAWIWSVVGILSSLFVVLVSKKAMLCLVLGWLSFTAIFTEEPKSLVRGLFNSNSGWIAIAPERRLIVASLNCAAGRIAPVREMLPYHPDIIFLQETPTHLDDLQKVANEFYGDKAFVLKGNDTTIITRFESVKLDEVKLEPSVERYLVHARLKTDSGYMVHVISTRLLPPVIDVDLLSADCWRAHYRDRISRLEQVIKIAAVVATIPKSEAVIVGGDFNVTANDGCLRPLRDRLRDSFREGGIGWGHTATNEVPLFRVDQVWTSKELKPIAITAIRTLNSDHRMVLCKLAIR